MRTLVVFSSLLALATACKGKPKHQEPPPNLPGSGSAVAHGSAAPMKPAPDIQLPHGDGSPPKKTTGPLDLDTLTKLQALTFTGFQLQPHGINPKMGMEVRQKTEDHPRIWATITVGPCSKEGTLGECTPIDLPKWKEKEAQLKASLMRPELVAAPDTVFELGIAQLNNTPVIFQYQLAQTQPLPEPGAGSGSAAKGSAAKGSAAAKEPAKGSGSAGSNQPQFTPGHFAWSHAYTLYYNDGANQIRVVAEYKDDPLVSKEAMAKEVPREDLENVARAFLEVYTQAW